MKVCAEALVSLVSLSLMDHLVTRHSQRDKVDHLLPHVSITGVEGLRT